MIENLVNGNLTDARDTAKHYSEIAIRRYCFETIGWTWKQAAAAAYYLKTGERFQAYCDSN